MGGKRRSRKADLTAVLKSAVSAAIAEALPALRKAWREDMSEAVSEAVSELAERDLSPHDCALVALIADASEGRPFLASTILAKSNESPTLKDSIADCLIDVESPTSLGTWLGKVKDKPIDGIVIRQLDRVGAGWRWVCRVCS